MSSPKVINNSLLNIILSFTAYEYSLASDESFYLSNRSTIADYSLSTLSSGDVVNPIFIDDNTKKSRTFWFISNEMAIQM